jgi:hypothetical protein
MHSLTEQIPAPLHAYTKLIESADVLRHRIELPPIDPIQGARILNRAAADQPLPVLGAWSLSRAEAQRIEQEQGGAPLGGWAALTQVVAGTGLLHCLDDRFIAASNEADWSDEQLQRALIEALTVRACPPVLIVTLCALAGISAVAILHIMQPLHDGLVSWGQQPDSERTRGLHDALTSQPDEQLVCIHFFGMLGAILEALATLTTSRTYPILALSDLLHQAALHTRRKLLAQLSPFARARFLSGTPELPHPAKLTYAERAAHDLLDHFLIPAGLALPVSTTRFLPMVHLLRGTFDVVTHHGSLARSLCLNDLLTERVATHMKKGA